MKAAAVFYIVLSGLLYTADLAPAQIVNLLVRIIG